MFKYCKQNN